MPIVEFVRAQTRRTSRELAHVSVGLTSLTLALAMYLFLEAVLEFVLSFQKRPLPGSGWLFFGESSP